MWRRLSDRLRVLSPRRSNRRSSELTESDWRGGKAPSVKAGSTASDNGSASPAGRSGDEPPSRPAAPPLSDFLKPPRARKPRTAFVLRSAVLLNVRVDARDDELREAYLAAALHVHPDRNAPAERRASERRFSSVRAAYDALRSTPLARRAELARSSGQQPQSPARPNGAPLPPSLGAAQSSSTALVTTNYFRKLRSRPWLGAAAPAPVPAPPAPRPALAALAATSPPAAPVAAAAPRPAAPSALSPQGSVAAAAAKADAARTRAELEIARAELGLAVARLEAEVAELEGEQQQREQQRRAADAAIAVANELRQPPPSFNWASPPPRSPAATASRTTSAESGPSAAERSRRSDTPRRRRRKKRSPTPQPQPSEGGDSAMAI